MRRRAVLGAMALLGASRTVLPAHAQGRVEVGCLSYGDQSDNNLMGYAALGRIADGLCAHLGISRLKRAARLGVEDDLAHGPLQISAVRASVVNREARERK